MKINLATLIVIPVIFIMIIAFIIGLMTKKEFPSDNKINYKDDLLELNNVG